MRVKCPRCGYEWEYKGKRMRVTCPNCGYTFRLTMVSREARKDRREVEKTPAVDKLIEVLVLGDYDCVKRVLRDAGVEIREGSAGFDTGSIDEELAEKLWKRIQAECMKQ